MGKHAYLIMAHNNFSQLKKLLRSLDYVDNDIYLHIDKKTKDIPFYDLKSVVRQSQMSFIKRISVYWGHSSQIKCELNLLTAALSGGEYDYFHLISGVDLPLKPQEDIHRFFDEHSGKQFLQIGGGNDPFCRINSVHFRPHQYFSKPLRYLESAINHFHVDRGEGKLKALGRSKLVKTANWFSITGDCAKYVVSQRKEILRFVRFSLCADELFVGTLLYGTKYWDEIYKNEPSSDGHMRFIDWIHEGPKPHVFTMTDQQRLDESNLLFARKFDERVDSQIIDYIVKKVSN